MGFESREQYFVQVGGGAPSNRITKAGGVDQRGAPQMIVIDEPEWMKGLRPDALLNSRDVTATFGFKDQRAVHALARAGSFPEPDVHINGVKASKQWRVSTIRQEIERRKRKAKGE